MGVKPFSHIKYNSFVPTNLYSFRVERSDDQKFVFVRRLLLATWVKTFHSNNRPKETSWAENNWTCSFLTWLELFPFKLKEITIFFPLLNVYFLSNLDKRIIITIGVQSGLVLYFYLNVLDILLTLGFFNTDAISILHKVLLLLLLLLWSSSPSSSCVKSNMHDIEDITR